MSDMNETEETNVKTSTKITALADKLIKLTSKGAQKLEEYAKKSAEENQNENAKKLAATMEKLHKTLEEKHDDYLAEVEKNAEELIVKGKQTLDSAKKIYNEMKTRAEAAKEKANKDAEIETLAAPDTSTAEPSADAPKPEETASEETPAKDTPKDAE